MTSSIRSVICFIALFIATSTAHAQWDFVRKTDPVTDQTTAFIGAQALESSASLSIRCENDAPLFLLQTNDQFYPERNGLIEVTTRVDKEEPVTRSWAGNRLNRFIISPESETALAYDMKKGNRLIVRIDDKTGGQNTYFFTLSGVTAGFNKMPCNPKERPGGREGRSLTMEERIKPALEKKLKGLFD